MNLVGRIPRGRRLDLLIAAGLFSLAFALYFGTTRFDFIYSWDDQVYVVYNPIIRSLSPSSLRTIFTRPILGNYFPLQSLSYALDYLGWGLDPFGYHLTNLVLHGLNGMLVYWVLGRLGLGRGSSLGVACLFVVHPVNVETVAWISQRKTLLSSSFALLSLGCYLVARQRRSRRGLALSVVLFALGLLSKTSVVGLPLILCLFERLGRSSGSSEYRPTIPFFLVASLAAVGQVLASLNTGAVTRPTLSASALFGVIYPTMITVYPKYLILLFWPFELSAFYDTPIHRSLLSPVVVALLLVYAGCTYAWWRARDRELRFWTAWAVVWFLPMSNLVPVQVFYADRYLYLSQIGIFAVVGHLLSRPATRPWRRLRRRAGGVGLALVLAALAVTNLKRQQVWSDEISLWEDTLAKYPTLVNQRVYLAGAYARTGRYREAEQQYLAALRLRYDPDIERALVLLRHQRRGASRMDE